MQDRAKLLGEIDAVYGKSRLYVNEGSGLGDKLLVQYSQDRHQRHYPLYHASAA